MDHAKTLWELVNKLDWESVMLCHFKTFENGMVYQIIRYSPEKRWPAGQKSFDGHDIGGQVEASAQHETLGWGTTPQEAVENMHERDKRGSGE